MGNNIDNIVKEALLDEVKEISNMEDIFYRIEGEIKTGSVKGSKDRKHVNAGFGFKRYFSLAACFLLVLTTLVFAFSAQARTLTVQAIASIKTIFVLEKVDNNLQVVEKPADEALTIPSVARVTERNEEEIGIKLGFKVRFPESLCDSYKLERRFLGVELKKQLDYETSLKIEKEMYDAIEDDNALNRLKPYGAARHAFVKYSEDGGGFFVCLSQTQTMSEVANRFNPEVSKKVKVGELDGMWIEGTVPVYHAISRNGGLTADMSVEPFMDRQNFLIWEKAGVVYIIPAYEGRTFTLKNMIKIAEDFMKYN